MGQVYGSARCYGPLAPYHWAVAQRTHKTRFREGLTAAQRQAPAELVQRVREVLELLRPSIQADGGDIRLVSVSAAGVVRVAFEGACLTCPSSDMTLKMGVEENLKRNIPEITRVEAVSE